MTLDETARRCSLPGCPAWFDAVAVAEGRAQADGWMRWNPWSLRLCPDHSWLWRAASGQPAAPHGVNFHWGDRTMWVRCACGWEMDSAGLTAGDMAAQYVGHLAEAVSGRGER